jgi:hypothetical protein
MPDVGSQVLEVAIGLLFVYLVFSLVCSAVQELVATGLSWRAKNLEEGLRSMLQGKEKPELEDPVLAELAKHPRVRAMLARKRLFGRNQGFPAYMSARTFSLVLLDTLAPADSGGSPRLLATRIREGLDQFPDAIGLKRDLLAMLEAAGEQRDRLRTEIEHWFDDTMNRVSGWYRRKTQVFLVIFGLAVAAIGNIDTIYIVDRLWNDPAARSAVVAQAQQTGAGAASVEELRQQVDTVGEIRALQLPVGWTTPATGADTDPRAFPESIDFLKVVGIVLSGLALSFGAPFWFDALGKISRLRGTGKPEGRVPGSPNP